MAKAPKLPEIKKVTGKYSPLFSGEHRTRIAQQYKAGEVIAVLATRNDCSVAKIRRILLDLGVTMRARGPLEGKKKVIPLATLFNKHFTSKEKASIERRAKKKLASIRAAEVKTTKKVSTKSTEYLPQSAGPQKAKKYQY